MKQRRSRQKNQASDAIDLPPLQARNRAQAYLLENLSTRQLTFAIGPAGTGKTYVASRFACEVLEEGVIEKIIVTRPMVPTEHIGFLPGGADMKFAPYFAPVREILSLHFGEANLVNLIKTGQVEIAPLAFLRGHTFRKSFVLFDEAQNTTPGQMKMFLSRIGEGTTVCVSGDPDQVDLPGLSGLTDAIDRLRGVPEVGFTFFGEDDVVRSNLVRKILLRYRETPL